jgi:stage II sporulation protein D
MKYIFGLIFLLSALCTEAKQMRINILDELNTRKMSFSPQQCAYSMTLNEDKIIAVKQQDVITLSYIGKSQVHIIKNGISVGTYKKIVFSSEDSLPSFKLSISLPKTKVAVYEDVLEVQAYDGELYLFNLVEMPHYIAGVLESEIGNVRYEELLKVQAVISRTYALKHIDRHKPEGYELCDKVHCQVYHGKSRFNPAIKPAVDSTGELIVVDENLQLIEAVFSANCGGQTTNSEDIWSKQRSYLRSVCDTFCITEKQAFWEKRIPKSQWLAYMSKKLNKTVSDPCLIHISDRKVLLPCYEVSYKDLRGDFKLRSTFFDIDEDGDMIVLKGRGFGHGVGMCQEGSTRMAALGYHFTDIIKLYYTNVQVIDARDLNLE